MPKKLIILLSLICLVFFVSACKKTADNTRVTNTNTNTTPAWQEQGVVVSGQYADAEILDLGNSQYRLYYAAEPETPDFAGQIYSSVSSDGITWTKEEGVRKTWAVFFDVVKLPDGRFRAYFQNDQVIKSAVSEDGLNWTDEPGVRIDKSEPGFNLESVGAQSTYLLPDKTYIMVYRGTINEPYETSEKVPNQTTQLYFWASSRDGLAWEKKGLAFDSRNETLYGLADGAEWVKWDNGELRVYFWSYAGIYRTVYSSGAFSAPVFDWSNNENANLKFVPNPPCDPTLEKINGAWFMYYGQHAKGIYYAAYK
ncbi:MAG: hypothetical protein WC528_03445 [Patescibacteria group bacterium]